jgi:hypothetical protein
MLLLIGAPARPSCFFIQRSPRSRRICRRDTRVSGRRVGSAAPHPCAARRRLRRKRGGVGRALPCGTATRPRHLAPSRRQCASTDRSLRRRRGWFLTLEAGKTRVCKAARSLYLGSALFLAKPKHTKPRQWRGFNIRICGSLLVLAGLHPLLLVCLCICTEHLIRQLFLLLGHRVIEGVEGRNQLL